MFLLDTNVVSELWRKRPHGGVVAWLNSVGTDALFMSAMTIGELQAGAERLRSHDPAKASAITSWIDQLVETNTILPLDTGTLRRWAVLIQDQPANLFADAMIGATALVHNLTVATRNLRDFERLRIPALNPFAIPI